MENSFIEWLQDITIYHKRLVGYKRYNLKASLRNTSIKNRNNTGVSNSDKAIIRIFNLEGYNNTWKVSKGDIIVNKLVTDEVLNAPQTTLSKKYGEENVYQVKSIDEFILNDVDLPNHIKIGAI